MKTTPKTKNIDKRKGTGKQKHKEKDTITTKKHTTNNNKQK